MNRDEIVKKVLLLLSNSDEFFDITSKLNAHVSQTLKTCIEHVLNEIQIENNKKLFEIDAVLDILHDEINTGHWSDIPVFIRQNFSITSYLKCILLLKYSKDEKLLEKCLKCIDMGLLLGAPLSTNDDLLSETAKYISNELYGRNKHNIIIEGTKPSQKRPFDETYTSYNKIKAIEIDIENCPSIEHFNKKYFKTQIPVKIKGCMSHWPAMSKWLDLNYLLKVAGDRTVPVEIGSHYVDENWSQKLMILREFIQRHYLSDQGDIGYLAQHNLFDQIQELKGDICIPEYCCLSENYDNTEDPDINAWFGPQGTVSPLHQDPKNNILTQVYGTKQIILFSTIDSEYLYPHEGKMLFNTAQVNPLEPDLEKFPNFSKASMYKCLLEPGEMLFIPVKWWHHVTALDKSFSVSFWWK